MMKYLKKIINKRMLVFLILTFMMTIMVIVLSILINNGIIFISKTLEHKGWYLFFSFEILFETLIWLSIYRIKNGRKKSVKQVDISKIQDYGISRFMLDETLSHEQQNKQLKEFHIHYDCNEPKCNVLKTKKEFKKPIEPSWVQGVEFRHKKTNKLLRPPLELEFIKYEDDMNVFDGKGYKKEIDIFYKTLKNKTQNYNMTYHTLNKLHQIVIGATGSGKTQKIIFPGIIYNIGLEFEKKPTIVVTDPKGEIYQATSGYAEKNDYKVLVLNFREATSSHNWNPLANSWRFRYEANTFIKNQCITKKFTTTDSTLKFLQAGEILIQEKLIQIKCYLHDLIDCADCKENFVVNLEKMKYKEKEEIKIYISGGKWFIKENDFNEYTKSKIQVLKASSEKEISTFAEVLIPSNTKGDSFWQDGARAFFVGLSITMLEMMDSKLDLVTLEKFNMINIIKMMSNPKLKEWFNKYKEYKDEEEVDSQGFEQATGTVNSSDATKQSLVSSAKTSTNKYTYADLQGLLCNTNNQINLDDVCYGESPYIIYLIIPDDDTSLHGLAATFVDQLYKAGGKIGQKNLLEGRTTSATLTRQIQFYLDEFGNMPRIPSFPSMITVARSKNIFFMLIVQDYKQLEKTYEKSEADTIKSNCNNMYYIRTNDAETAERISNDLGKKPIINFNVNDKFDRVKVNLAKGQVIQEDGGSLQTVPLISGDQLLKIDDHLSISKKTGKNPVKLFTIYSYLIKDYNKVMGMTPVHIPTNNINYRKDYYFNIFEKDYKEWLIHIGDDEEEKLTDSLQELNSSLKENESLFEDNEKEIDDLIQEQHDINEKTDDFDRKHRRSKIGDDNEYEERKNRREDRLKRYRDEIDKENEKEDMSNDILDMFNKKKDVFISKEDIVKKIKANLSKIDYLKEEYNNYKSLLQEDMSEEDQSNVNALWEEQKNIGIENVLLLKELKK